MLARSSCPKRLRTHMRSSVAILTQFGQIGSNGFNMMKHTSVTLVLAAFCAALTVTSAGAAEQALPAQPQALCLGTGPRSIVPLRRGMGHPQAS